MTTLNIPDNLPLSRYLFKQCKLWVWDFDDTLIDVGTYLVKNMQPDAIAERSDAELDKEVPQWRYFRQLVEFLVGHGRYVSIASFGTLEIILAYMKRIFGFNQQFFTKKNIIAPCFQDRATNRFNIPPNKNEYIYALMRIYRVQDFKRVVLFDDKPSNISDAIAIGIIGVQIATPGNGDNPNAGKMYFGPWNMEDFDKNIKNKCGEEIYLNRTYTGIGTKENYTGIAYNTMGKGDINFGTGVRSQNNYFMEPYPLGVDDSSAYKTPAFGTGIGDRKVLNQPQFRWNGYKNNRKLMPKWSNGNYVNVPGYVETEGYWDASTLGGSSLGFWDKYHSVSKNADPKDTINNSNDISLDYVATMDDGVGTVNSYNKKVVGISEGFSTNGSDCNSCKKLEWNWIVLLLLLIVLGMVIFIVRMK